MFQQDNRQSGYTALILVTIVSSVVLIVALLLSSLSLTETTISNDNAFSERALQLADSCADEAILRLNREFNGEEPTYTGGTLNINSNSCTITVTPSGSNRIVDITAIYQTNTTKKIQLTVQMSPSFDVVSWQEQ